MPEEIKVKFKNCLQPASLEETIVFKSEETGEVIGEFVLKSLTGIELMEVPWDIPKILSKAIKSWSLKDEKENPLPITPENCSKLVSTKFIGTEFSLGIRETLFNKVLSMNMLTEEESKNSEGQSPS